MADQYRPQDNKIMMGRGDPISKNMSPFNSMDLAMAAKNGDIPFDIEMPVIEFLPKIGIDPNGPVRQLLEVGQKMTQNGDMLGKMKNIVGIEKELKK